MIERLRNFFSERKERKRLLHKKLRRERLGKIIREAKSTNNDGLLRRQLLNIAGVVHVSTESGGFRRAFVDVQMSDGYEITTSDLLLGDALKKAIARAVSRLRTKGMR